MYRREIRNSRSGFSLVEVGLVLAIVSVLVSGALVLYGAVVEFEKAREATEQILAINRVARDLYSDQVDNSGLSEAIVVGTRSLPRKWVSGDTIRNPWGGQVFVYSALSQEGVGRGVTVVTHNVSAAACIRMAMLDMGALTINTYVNNTAEYMISQGRPLTPEEASRYCVGDRIQMRFAMF